MRSAECPRNREPFGRASPFRTPRSSLRTGNGCREWTRCTTTLAFKGRCPAIRRPGKQVVEPEVVATAPNRFKRPVPVRCGFSSAKMVGERGLAPAFAPSYGGAGLQGSRTLDPWGLLIPSEPLARNDGAPGRSHPNGECRMRSARQPLPAPESRAKAGRHETTCTSKAGGGSHPDRTGAPGAGPASGTDPGSAVAKTPWHSHGQDLRPPGRAGRPRRGHPAGCTTAPWCAQSFRAIEPVPILSPQGSAVLCQTISRATSVEPPSQDRIALTRNVCGPKTLGCGCIIPYSQ